MDSKKIIQNDFLFKSNFSKLKHPRKKKQKYKYK